MDEHSIVRRWATFQEIQRRQKNLGKGIRRKGNGKGKGKGGKPAPDWHQQSSTSQPALQQFSPLPRASSSFALPLLHIVCCVLHAERAWLMRDWCFSTGSKTLDSTKASVAIDIALSRRRECPATGHCCGGAVVFSSALLPLPLPGVCAPDCDVGESLDVTNAGIPLAQHCSL